METTRTFPLVGGPFDGRENAMALDQPPEHLLIAIPDTSPRAGGEPATRVAVYRREQVGDGAGDRTTSTATARPAGSTPERRSASDAFRARDCDCRRGSSSGRRGPGAATPPQGQRRGAHQVVVRAAAPR